ncbi:MAG: alkanesulfonate monooxygenase SsuD [Halioglobus sp.]|jgi:alkanesulfonate monooxygenase SsuD/methylene tetrahydromethanopterin reductase-like flavin-dependent oxidoreductase (luciferase family)
MTTKLKVGTTLWSWRELGAANALCQQAEQAEAMGFHSFWLPENHFAGSHAIPQPLTLLAAIAARTSHIKLGCTSLLLPIRNPLLAAEEVAVVDQLSEGRLILGVGRGIQGAMFKAFDVPTGDKRKLFQANLDIMRSAWDGKAIAEEENGTPIRLSPLPVQRPSPPIWVAAFGPLALKQVAGLGLPYLASPVESLATLEQHYRDYHQGVSDAGLPAVNIIPVMRTIFVCKKASQIEEIRGVLAKTVMPAMAERAGEVTDWAIVGDRSYVRDKLAEYRERLSLTHLIARAGVAGVSSEEQLRSHEALLDVAVEH